MKATRGAGFLAAPGGRRGSACNRSRKAAQTIAALVLAALALSCGAQEPERERRQFTFSWPFEPDDEMRPRGGSTTGTEITLLGHPTEEWRALQEPGLTELERDRRAILAMAGGYRTSFDFIETVGFTPDFAPTRPYQSWGTEYVYVVEDTGEEIVLQHIMVMFFEDAEGTVHGPIVQKHWRQDWRYEDRDLHEFAGRDRWRRRTLEPAEADGRWTQAVFQVDDSPRYESFGEWVHDANYSAWTSAETWRPLPRRESSVRDDYHVLIGTNRHTITPGGWVQEEENLKVALDAHGNLAAERPYLARELGVNRYERIVDFDFSAGDRYWEATSPFWREVRNAWADIFAASERFAFHDEVAGIALFEPMFEYAARLEAGEPYDAADARAFIRAKLDEHIQPR